MCYCIMRHIFWGYSEPVGPMGMNDSHDDATTAATIDNYDATIQMLNI